MREEDRSVKESRLPREREPAGGEWVNVKGRGGTHRASGCMRIGCVNVRGWGTGKFEDLCKELNEWSLDVVGITETHLRDVVHMEGNEFVMIGKGRRKQDKLGGGVALLHKKVRNLRVEELDIGDSAESEDVLAVRVECRSERGRAERIVVVVVYMTVEGDRAVRENGRKYSVLKKIAREYAGERVIVMGDMNAW